MTPEERQLLSGLFDRIKGGSSQQRDGEAESFINDSVRQQPYAPYLLAQTVIVQEQALRAASDRLQQLEQQLRDQQAHAQPQQGQGGGGFLGGLGRMFGGDQNPQQQPPGGYGQQGGNPYSYPPQGGPQQGGPWGNQNQGGWGGQPQQQGGGFMGGMGAGGGGGFLKGALGAAAGVAGGVLLADSIRGLFGGHNNPLGIASGFEGGGFGGQGGGETIVNNYYENPQGGSDAGGFDNAADFSDDEFDPGSDGDDSYNV